MFVQIISYLTQFFLIFLQVLLQDIKTHGSFVTSLIKQYELKASSTNKSSATNTIPINNCTSTSTTSALTTNLITTTTASTFTNSSTVNIRSEIVPLNLSGFPQPSVGNNIDSVDTPRDSIETVTPRENTETFSTYSTAASTPRDLLTATTTSPREGTTSLHRAKRSVPRKARNLENRYHRVFLRALEWQCLIEQEIAQCKVWLVCSFISDLILCINGGINSITFKILLSFFSFFLQYVFSLSVYIFINATF